MVYLKDISNNFAAAQPAVQVIASSGASEARVIREIHKFVAQPLSAHMFIFDLGDGMHKIQSPKDGKGVVWSEHQFPIESDPLLDVVDYIKGQCAEGDENASPDEFRAIYIFRDCSAFLAGEKQAVSFVAKIKNLLRLLQKSQKRVIFLETSPKHARELSGLFPVIYEDAPGEEQFVSTIHSSLQELEVQYKKANRKLRIGKFESDDVVRAARECLGLSTDEVSTQVRIYAIKNDARVDMAGLTEHLQQYKIAELAKAGAHIMPKPDNQVGGLSFLKSWASKRKAAFWAKPGANPILKKMPNPKGLLLVGVSGCGKSLAAKAIAQDWGVVALQLDIGSLMKGIVGETEATVDRLLKLIDACAPCVLFIDELDKAFGDSSYDGDGGVGKRIIQKLLTWMNDRQSKVFVVATANDISRLRQQYPELLRKGRFDETMFLDLPNAEERAQIFAAVFESYGVDFQVGTAHVDASAGFVGAEILSVVGDAIMECLDYESQELNVDAIGSTLLQIIESTMPMSASDDTRRVIHRLREYARKFAKPASGKFYEGDELIETEDQASDVPAMML